MIVNRVTFVYIAIMINTKEDGERWEPLPDPAGMPNEYINAKKPFEEQM